MASFEQEAEKNDAAANHGTQKLLFLVIISRILFKGGLCIICLVEHLFFLLLVQYYFVTTFCKD